MAAEARPVRVALLGEVALRVGERTVALGGPKQRVLLALLALDPGKSVSVDRASAALWSDSSPDGQARRLHTVVSRLRAALREAGGSPEIVERTESGYRLSVDPDQVDTARAMSALRQTRELRAAGRSAEAVAAARRGLELWHGEPLADVPDKGWATDQLQRLADLRLSLLEEEFESRLTLGATPALVDEIAAVCPEEPLRERLHAQLVRALGACGRRAEALNEYDRVRRRLSEELGIGPGAVLREAHLIVLGPPSRAELPSRAEPPVATVQPRAPRRRRRLLVAGVAAAVAAAAATAGLSVGNGRTDPPPMHLAAGVLVIAGPGLHHVRAQIPVSGTIINEQPGGLVLGAGSLWAVSEKGTVTQVDLASGRVVGSTPLALPAGPGGMAVGLGATWVTDSGSATLYRISSGVTAARTIRLAPLVSRQADRTGGVAVAAGSVWLVRTPDTVDRLSRDGQLQHRFSVRGAAQVVSDGSDIWVISRDAGVVTRIDPRTDMVRARAQLRPQVCCLTFGGGYVWATSEARGLLWQLRRDGEVQDLVQVPAPLTEVAYAHGAVWVSGFTARTVTRVDARTLGVRVIRTGQPVAGLVAARGVVAFSTFPNPQAALADLQGPVARIVMTRDVTSDTDPAAPTAFGVRDGDRQRLEATCLSLYHYRGGRLLPYAVRSPAVRSSHGRVWTFQVRRGFGFSPPSHETVDASTFAATIERSASPVFRRSRAGDALGDVVGMASYRAGRAAHVEGVSAHGLSLTLRLRRPVPDLDARLAEPEFCAVPKDTPAVALGLQDAIPSAGPYYTAAQSGGGFAVLRRNTRYPGPSSGFAAFVYTFNVDEQRALQMVRRGRADYAPFFRGDAASTVAGQVGSADRAAGLRFRSLPPGATQRSRPQALVAELFGPRLGCRSYGPLYAGVELERLCVTSAAD